MYFSWVFGKQNYRSTKTKCNNKYKPLIPNAQEEIVCSIIFNSTDLNIEIHPARTEGVNKSELRFWAAWRLFFFLVANRIPLMIFLKLCPSAFSSSSSLFLRSFFSFVFFVGFFFYNFLGGVVAFFLSIVSCIFFIKLSKASRPL